MRKALWAVLINIIGCFILMVLACLAGVVMFAYYAQSGCDPLSDGEVDNANQLIPYFVMEVLGYPGLPGLFVSCLFSGALSSVSSSLNALAAVFWQDIFKPLIGEKISESSKTCITRLLVAVVGAAGIGFAFLAQNLGGTVLQASFSFTGAASGPLLGIFLLGGLFPFANAAGCVFGGILGLVLALWISIGSYSLPNRGYALEFPTAECSLQEVVNNATTSSPVVTLSAVQHFYTVSYLWFPAIGTASTVIIGVLVSLITRPFFPKRDIDPKYLIPLFDRLFCCLPESWRKPCRCGYDFKAPEDLIDEEEDMELSDKNVNFSDAATMNGTQKRSDNDEVFRDGVYTLSYRPSKSEFVYDNSMFTGEEQNGGKTFYVSNV